VTISEYVHDTALASDGRLHITAPEHGRTAIHNSGMKDEARRATGAVKLATLIAQRAIAETDAKPPL
jgi:hypothetical protein